MNDEHDDRAPARRRRRWRRRTATRGPAASPRRYRRGHRPIRHPSTLAATAARDVAERACRGDRRSCGRLTDRLDDVVGVAEPDEDRLVGAGRHRHALVQHGVEERGVRRLVGAPGRRRSRPAAVRHRTRCRPACRPRGTAPGSPAAAQASRSSAARWRARAGSSTYTSGSAPRAQRARLRWRAGCPDNVPAWNTGPSGESVSMIARAPADGADRQAATDDLAERREVGRHVVLRSGRRRHRCGTR